MTKPAWFFLALKVTAQLVATVNLGISTAFLLHKPVSFFELGVIYSLLLGTSFALEYPSGNLADRYGRKLVYACGLFAVALQFGLYAASATVALLYLAAVLGGIGDALISGSLEAWLGEEDARRGGKAQFHRVFGLTRAIGSLLAIGASLALGLLLHTDLRFVYWGAALALGLAALCALLFFPDNRGEGKSIFTFTTATARVYFYSPALICLSLILSAAFACYAVFILYWQPRGEELGVVVQRLPLLNAAHLVGVAASGCLYGRLARKLGAGSFLYAAFALIAAAFACMTFGAGLPALLAGLLAFGLGFGSVIPLFFDWSLDIMPRDLRASTLSLLNAQATLVAVITTALLGKVIELWGLGVAPPIGLGLAMAVVLLLGPARRLAMVWERQRAGGQAVADGGLGGL